MTIYDANKQLYAQLPQMTIEERVNSINLVRQFGENHPSEYYMLLCNEQRYYTIFHQKKENARKAMNEVYEIAQEIGEIKSVELTEDGTAIEFWIVNNSNECNMYMLFDYTKGVIEN